jgi:transposase-like protein
MRRRRFTPEFKSPVVLEILSGAMGVAEACRKHRLDHQVLSRWKSDFLERAPQLFCGDPQREADLQRIDELERLVGRLTMEIAILKKASRLLDSPLRQNGR